ncbi:MATE family efflux transporter [Leucobacter sp. USHLN153]|uniref:MATE family efflux transporter n=1 Tax=Leucobacter sp. USHLN153 TaxID=3081268 RepID=UPI003016BFD6
MPLTAARAERRAIDRSIANLAIPALGALIAEPLFLIVDSALIGHLGAEPLAGLAIAGSILQTAVGLMVFLAYATTPLVARRRGAGDLRGAVQAGVDGLWLALGIGVAVGGAMWAASRPLVEAFGAGSGASAQATTYLTISCLGIPAMLVVYAASGLLRGLQDTKTPLVVATIGFALNAVLNAWFIYGLGLGIAGSAWGTVLAQWAMVGAYLVVVARHARRAGVGPLPHHGGLASVGRSGGWLFVRTLGLRAAFLATVLAAASHGTTVTAGYQVVFTIFTTAAFALDALAIAAQALIGDALGSRDAARAKAVVRRTMLWGVGSGVVVGAALILASPLVGRAFTSDGDVLALLPAALVVLGASLPLGGFVFVLDGVLMGAGDARYLAWTSLAGVAVYLPLLWAATALVAPGASSLVALTASFSFIYMAARAVALGLRARGDRWVRLGV